MCVIKIHPLMQALKGLKAKAMVNNLHQCDCTPQVHITPKRRIFLVTGGETMQISNFVVQFHFQHTFFSEDRFPTEGCCLYWGM